jgi:glycogen debranching enzyme
MGDALFSGWGVRTMAVGEGGYNPIRYHNGTVWPHDNSLIALGLLRYGYRAEAARIAMAILEAATYFDYRLPEVFAGYPREQTRFPVEYPTASSPQAWATGTPFVFLRTMLGLEPDGDELVSDPVLPDGIGRLELRGVPGRWGRVDIHTELTEALT